MFSLREFIKKGFLNAVGKMGDYQIILNSAEWHSKGVLLEEDLQEINAKIDEQYIVKEVEETPIEEVEELPVDETPVEEMPVEEGGGTLVE